MSVKMRSPIWKRMLPLRGEKTASYVIVFFYCFLNEVKAQWYFIIILTQVLFKTHFTINFSYIYISYIYKLKNYSKSN